ncbi:(deoxy)nucleoside triphosphate pyrophosphohydrolase [Treponema brennaborense]|uniref:8-oxo-dGTP diphosphatase n=1 Tax=Treponema brennaborense (strain DSM 12168 / CIP 105900 / DD5/3) TaxID=906968 RepID=F4LM60_TREBD|nr:NUDIX domain-containing protein [Treponema brennaborense]AEE16739.1 NUDIX hydrolase [Treponema brennaborense DSM 12168]
MIKDSIACIVVRNDTVLIGKRIREGQMGGRWEFPGGKVEPGETLEQAVVREFAEEFSVPVCVGELIAEAEFTHNGTAITLHAFHVHIAAEPPAWQLTEHTEIKWVPFAAIPSLRFVDSDMLIYPAVRAYFEGAAE